MPCKRIMRAINKQILAKCQSWKALVMLHKEALATVDGKVQTLEQQAEDLSVRHGAA